MTETRESGTSGREPYRSLLVPDFLFSRRFLVALTVVIIATSVLWVPGAYRWILRQWTLHLFATAGRKTGDGQFDGAISDYTRILAVNASDSAHGNVALLLRRDCLRYAGKLAEALADANQLADGQPYCEALLARAEILLDLSRLKEAAADCDLALTRILVAPHDLNGKYTWECRCRLLRARIHEAAGEFGAAEDVLSRQINILGIDEACYVARATLRSRHGDAAGAMLDFERALELEENDRRVTHDPAIVARSPFANFLATCADERFRDGQRALGLATKACELSEYRDPTPLLSLAAAYAEIGDFDAAVKWQRTCNERTHVDLEKSGITRLECYLNSKAYRFETVNHPPASGVKR